MSVTDQVWKGNVFHYLGFCSIFNGQQEWTPNPNILFPTPVTQKVKRFVALLYQRSSSLQQRDWATLFSVHTSLRFSCGFFRYTVLVSFVSQRAENCTGARCMLGKQSTRSMETLRFISFNLWLSVLVPWPVTMIKCLTKSHLREGLFRFAVCHGRGVLGAGSWGRRHKQPTGCEYCCSGSCSPLTQSTTAVHRRVNMLPVYSVGLPSSSKQI